MFGLLSVLKKAQDEKSNLLGNSQGFRDKLVQAKGDFVSQPMRDIGFGNADRITAPPVVNFDSGQAANTGTMMMKSLKDIGAYNPAAAMTDLGNLDLSLPRRASFSPAENDGYMTPLQRAQIEAAKDEMMLLDNIGSKEYMPSPQGGALRMA